MKAAQLYRTMMSVRLNLVHQLFRDMSAAKAKHQGGLFHRVALTIIIRIKISMIFGTI